MTTTIGTLELILNPEAALEIWLELRRAIRENPSDYVGDPLSPQERTLYEALTRRFIKGLTNDIV